MTTSQKLTIATRLQSIQIDLDNIAITLKDCQDPKLQGLSGPVACSAKALGVTYEVILEEINL